MLTHLSLFSGIGGLDLAAEWAGFTTAGQCEWADYPTKVLEKHWPDVPRWRDIRTLTGESFYERIGRRTVDVVSGGFPCQPFSVAGKQRGKSDDRFLWPEMLRVIRELAPHWVVGENVPGIINIAADDVCADLERIGYEVWIFDFEAAAVGAPHRRERIAFVAHATGIRCKGNGELAAGERMGQKQDSAHASEGGGVVANAAIEREGGLPIQQWGSRQAGFDAYGRSKNVAHTQGDIARGLSIGKGETVSGPMFGGENVEHSESAGLQERKREGAERQPGLECDGEDVSNANLSTPTRLGEHGGKEHARSKASGLSGPCGSDWWAVEPDVGRVAYGVPSRVDRLKCLGNAVVPWQFYPIFKAIAEVMRENDPR